MCRKEPEHRSKHAETKDEELLAEHRETGHRRKASWSPSLSHSVVHNSSSDAGSPQSIGIETSFLSTIHFCFNSSPDKMEEAGCAICGQLTPSSKLTRLKSVKQYLRILQTQGVTRVERKHSSKPIHEFKGPVLDYKCNRICDNCRKHLWKGNVP